MGLDFGYPWALVLLPAAVAAILWINRRYRHGKMSLKYKATLAARLVVTVLLVLAIAAPSLMMKAGTVTRWVVLDVSDSTKALRPQMETAAAEALAALPKGEQAGVIAFGNGAMVEVTPGETPVFTGMHTNVKGDATDLDDALLLVNALTPVGGSGSVTVISDGGVSVSPAVSGLLAGRGIKADGLLFQREASPDAQLSQLIAPDEVYEGQSVTVEAVIDSNAAMTGELALYQNGTLVSNREISLKAGENRFAFRETASETGVVTYEARLLVSGDSQSLNNSAASYVRVSGAPNVLLVTESSDASGLFSAAGMELTTARPSELFIRADDYLAYDVVVLNNIDYDSASDDQWTALDAAVRTLGRGLCVLGGDRSYALGGYRGTLLENLLPVRMDVKNKLQLPSLSLMIAIDKSGSMTEGYYGTSRIDVAKEAAVSALEVLTERDYIGVIGFDGAAKWVVPFQQAVDVESIKSMIATLRADGGTAFYTALQQSLETLLNAPTAQKHVIFLSDGQPGDAGFEELVSAMRQAGITLTTVAVGSDADTRLMKRLASIGGGRSYQADEFSNIPKIFAKETMMAGGSYVQNRVFTPVITENGALTAFEGFPALSGYLTATEKDTAIVSLTSDTDDPLLARWNVGAGKALCWMSDAQGAWTENYLRWQDAPAFFGGMAAAVMPGADRAGTLTATVDHNDMNVVYTVDDAAESGLVTEATVIAPDGSEQTIALHQTEPGRYEGAAVAEKEGAYALRVRQTQSAVGAETSEQAETNGQNAPGTQAVVRTQESGAVKAYAREYDLREARQDGLDHLIAQTGGRVLDNLDTVWNTSVSGTQTRRSLQGLLTLLALVFLLADIALRKLPWDDALLALLGRQKEKAEHPAHKPTRPDKPVRPGRSEQKRQKQQAANDTANALLNAQKARRGE